MLLFLLPRPVHLAAAAAVLFHCVSGQTWSKCNPLQNTCPAEPALGMAINVDFTGGPVNSFTSLDSPTFDSSGVHFTIATSGQAPQLASLFYIMFGRVEVTMTAAPGAGIVSSVVLQSDDLDEIDMEWLGARPDQVQSNYFGKGDTSTYNRAQTHTVPGGSQGPAFVTYTIDWTSERIVWTIAGTEVRSLQATDAAAGRYPQTPMQVKFGAWAGGDPNNNAAGTIAWALGPTNYGAGPFSMVVSSISVTDYSTGSQYRYSDQSGNWQSIVAVGGAVNGNLNAAGQVPITARAPASSQPANPGVPVGIGTATNQAGPRATIGSIPDGWRMTSSGKIVPIASASTPRPPSLAYTVTLLLFGCAVYLAVDAN